jgi:5-methylcytosine-specific restriction endonuclease McrA
MDREWLQEQLAAGHSLAAIAGKAGKGASTVAYWINRHGLVAAGAARHTPKGPIDEALLRGFVEQARSVRQIADEVGRSPSVVRYWLRRYGLTTRNRSLSVGTLPGTDSPRECELHRGVELRLHGGRRYRCPQCISEAVIARRRRVKAVLVREAGGACVVCGYDRYVGALQFHHRDPAQKAFAISLNGRTAALARLREEARKCVLLCGNCHAEVEAGMTQLRL